MLVMVVITDVMSLVTEISIVPIEACTISISIHIRIVATDYTDIHIRSIAAACTCVVAGLIWDGMSMVIAAMLSIISNHHIRSSPSNLNENEGHMHRSSKLQDRSIIRHRNDDSHHDNEPIQL